ncbi:hypothetical protein MUN82_09360 [Hymenobacter aerilatus]|uniref:O-antigen translocase n=1 Tax=Hymenobacter aerilatus TaxID=2932251 RepID=A0A8T9T3V6_9BACT|nr:hypothetical protein [Hymenobacter aerilatus]UOR07290.1 hypothetical protein MUN82_09360 [Hymenobacter aerilatus]
MSTLRRFLKGSVGAGVAVGARGIGAVVLNKLLAVYGGPGGLTLLAHFQNLLGLFTTLPGEGINVGITKYLAPLRAGSGRYRAWLGAGVLLNAGALLLGMGLLLLRPGLLAELLGPGLALRLGFGVGIVMLVSYALLQTLLLAAGRLRHYVLLTVWLSGLSVAAVAMVLLRGGSAGMALLVYLLAQGSVAVPALWLAFRSGLVHRWRSKMSVVALRGLGRFLLMAVSLLLFGKAVDFAVRDLLITRYGLARTDLWQAVVKLSDNYTMVFSAVVSSVYYPRLAALVGQPDAMRRYVRTVLLLLAPVLAAGLGFIYLLQSWLLPLLFEPRFLAARPLLAPQLIGDWAKFLSWVLLYQLTARAQVGRYVAVQMGAATLYVGILAVLLPRYQLLGATLTHAVHYCLLLMACAVYFRADWRPSA